MTAPTQTPSRPAWVALSFVDYRDDPATETGRMFSMWAPKVGSEYTANCATGRQYAAEMIDHVEQTGFAPILVDIVRAMPRGDALGGVEIGFLTGIAMAADGYR